MAILICKTVSASARNVKLICRNRRFGDACVLAQIDSSITVATNTIMYAPNAICASNL
jgi:hypothetical protein